MSACCCGPRDGPARDPFLGRLRRGRTALAALHRLRHGPDLPPRLLPRLRLDRNQIIQALLNLGRNALQAVGPRGRIVLRTRAITNASIGSRRYRVVASIQVEDDGPGVPVELKDTVFYPLVTGRQGGTGLGLAVAQDLIGRHDGLIEFDSRPGCTVFTILLPFENNELGESA